MDRNLNRRFRAVQRPSRSPQGELDRNTNVVSSAGTIGKSLSARRAWIEIEVENGFAGVLLSLSARRAWIEISYAALDGASELSLSARRAWIEIKIWYCGTSIGLSLSARRAWIEILALPGVITTYVMSLSARRAWIEIVIGGCLVVGGRGRSPQGERG